MIKLTNDIRDYAYSSHGFPYIFVYGDQSLSRPVECYIHIYRDATKVATLHFKRSYIEGATDYWYIPYGAIQAIDIPGAGTYQYSIKMQRVSTSVVQTNRLSVFAMEL